MNRDSRCATKTVIVTQRNKAALDVPGRIEKSVDGEGGLWRFYQMAGSSLLLTPSSLTEFVRFSSFGDSRRCPPCGR